MRVSFGEESRYCRVGVNNVEGIPREDIVTRCSRGSEVVRLGNCVGRNHDVSNKPKKMILDDTYGHAQQPQIRQVRES